MRTILCFLLLAPFFLQAQLEKVFVETYYISDNHDSSDTTGGILEAGSTTYRIYVDLAPGVKLTKVYGDANHALKISSSAVFFNNSVDGQTFGKDFSRNRYKENTVGLDTWLTLGQVSKTSAKTYFGVPKVNDSNGSFVGGINNDGGSAGIRGGLIANDAPAAGIPVTVADGIDSMLVVPDNWASYGIADLISSEDSTIFGSLKQGSEFISNAAALQNSGVMGVVADSNQVLVAQLTTKGEIAFELNIEVMDTNGITIKYVANGDNLVSGERVNPTLKYPPACGCNNPNYMEYSPNFACGVSDSCHQMIIFGCTDIMACNYDATANYAIPSMCCYPGSCNGLDVTLVCPQLAVGIEEQAIAQFEVYPNPAQERLTVQLSSAVNEKINYSLYDAMGRILLTNTEQATNGNLLYVNVADLAQGMYLLRLSTNTSSATKTFIKN